MASETLLDGRGVMRRAFMNPTLGHKACGGMNRQGLNIFNLKET
jgi:hypothetical protein